MRSGVLAGFPLVGVRATLVSVMVGEGHAMPAAPEIAARAAFREALKGTAVLLEPVMRIDVTVPEDIWASSRVTFSPVAATWCANAVHGGIAVIEATAPFSNLFGYANQLRSGTRGRGTFTMRFASYQPVHDPYGGKPLAVAAAMRA